MKYFLSLHILLLLILNVSAQNSYPTGMDFDDEQYATVLKKAKLTRSLDILPPAASVKQYAPIPASQGNNGTCVAWASAYCGKTIVEAIKNGWTDKQLITKNAYSPAFLFRMIKPNDNNCVGGSVLAEALATLKTKGVVPFANIPQTCIPAVNDQQLQQASSYKIKDYMKLFDLDAAAETKIRTVKKSLAEKKPVVFGMICPPSFQQAAGVWQSVGPPLSTQGGHAMCVVGYDDTKYGGAFEIQNSWGNHWANEGYIWIKYNDFAAFTRYAFEFVDLPAPKPQVPDLAGELKFVLSSGETIPATLFQSTRGLKVVTAKTAPGPLTLYKATNAYTSGTRFRIYISNNQPAYVYALSTDLSNEITKIFPYAEGISAALTDKKNDVAIPDEDHHIEFDDKPGRDLLCVLYSRNELDITDIIKQVAAQEGTFSEKIFKVLGNEMVEPGNITFSTDKVSFEGYSKGKSVVAMMMELEHK
ncbi:cysteine protease [Mucilaginibacter hurinus]|uniref:Cysteine protease n=1 Tax=Mucilaginibacter hurinus TaxID=2201324 RepID=A0A367GQH6_9SPHI|nr:C1 family peptidase [Mucilaginibacter hurinus]RCH55709.1 cysteine protease [Mucilaginibacter hurinus]